MKFSNSVRNRFNDKMDMIKKETGVHPYDKFLMMAGPENADNIMNMMLAIYNAGVQDAKAGKV